MTGCRKSKPPRRLPTATRRTSSSLLPTRRIVRPSTPQTPQPKTALNEAIAKLHDDKMDYNYFYSTINQYIQGADKGGSFRRARIEGQRKQEYNKDERKRGRNERYR